MQVQYLSSNDFLFIMIRTYLHVYIEMFIIHYPPQLSHLLRVITTLLCYFYSCHDNIVGGDCSACVGGAYNFSSSGCQLCNCSQPGSTSSDCNENGDCLCQVTTMKAKSVHVSVTASPFSSVSRLDLLEASVMSVTLDTTSLA